MESESRIRLGAERPYAVFIVRGVTYSRSAPVVIPVDAEDIEIIEFDDDCESTPNNAVVGAPTPATPQRVPGKVEYVYRVFAAMGAKGLGWAGRTGWLPLVFGPAPTTPLLAPPRAARRPGGGARGKGRKPSPGGRARVVSA